MMGKRMEFDYSQLAVHVGQALDAVERLHGEVVTLTGERSDPEQMAQVSSALEEASNALAAAAAEVTADRLALQTYLVPSRRPEKVDFRER